jgi:hypothetical protein
MPTLTRRDDIPPVVNTERKLVCSRRGGQGPRWTSAGVRTLLAPPYRRAVVNAGPPIANGGFRSGRVPIPRKCDTVRRRTLVGYDSPLLDLVRSGSVSGT